MVQLETGKQGEVTMDFWNILTSMSKHYLDFHVDFLLELFGLRSDKLLCTSGWIHAQIYDSFWDRKELEGVREERT